MASGEVVLYDSLGTAIPLPGPPTPPRISVIPDGVLQGPRDRYRGYPSRHLTPAKIAQILEAADGGDPHDWIELAEEMVEKDPKLGSVLHTRYSAVLGLPWEVAPARRDDSSVEDQALADEIAKFCFGALQSVNFLELVGDLLDAIAKPFAIDWIDWGEDTEGKVVPRLFRRIPPRHIRWSFDSDTVRILDPTKMNGTDPGRLLQPYETVRAISNDRRDHPTRAGCLRSLAWYNLFKIVAIKDMLAYADRYGMPVRVLKVDDPDFDNQERFDRFRASLANLGTDASAIFTKNAELEVMSNAMRSGIDVFIAIIDYCDKAIAWLILGHELSSQSSPGSGQLGVSASIEVRQDILEGDCEFISGIIKRDVLNPMVGWNFGWDRIDLTPNVYFDYEPPRDLAAEATTVRIIAKTFPGLRFSEQALREKYGIDEPLDDEDVLEPETGSSSGFAPDLPQLPGDEEPDVEPDVTVNRTLAVSRRRRIPRYSKAKQRKVDRLADRGIRAGNVVSAAWNRQLRDLLREARADGVSLSELRDRIVKAYPTLDVSEIERQLQEQSVLVRLYGRNG